MQESDFDNIANKLFVDHEACFEWEYGGIYRKTREVQMVLRRPRRDLSGRWMASASLTLGVRRVNMILLDLHECDTETIEEYFGGGRPEALSADEIPPFTAMINAIRARAEEMFEAHRKSLAAVEAAISASGMLKAPVDPFTLTLPE